MCAQHRVLSSTHIHQGWNSNINQYWTVCGPHPSPGSIWDSDNGSLSWTLSVPTSLTSAPARLTTVFTSYYQILRATRRFRLQLGIWRRQDIWSLVGSTAQRFKNIKPIGEIGCCESGMAERIHWWTKGAWGLLSFSLFLDYLPTYHLSYVSIYLVSLSLSFI